MSRLKSTSAAVTLVALFCSSTAYPHTFEFTECSVAFEGGAYQIDLKVDLDALALGVSPVAIPSHDVVAALMALPEEEFQTAVERARRTIATRVRVDFDGERALPAVSFPEFTSGRATGPHMGSIGGKPAEPTLLGLTARLSGAMPPSASTFRFGASRAFQVVHLTIQDHDTGAVVKHVLGVSEDSPPFRLRGGGGPPAEGASAVVMRFVRLGFKHILPKGADHILFVLGLFLLSTRLPPLLWQISAFTVAHTLTLALAASEVLALSPMIVEPLIALSISYVAFENLATSKLQPWRPALVFAFGLLHGMGFAGVLRELGLPRDAFLASLVGFNVGVELGQLAVVALAFLLVGWARKRAWYRRAIVLPLSLGIGVIGLYWAAERVFGGSLGVA